MPFEFTLEIVVTHESVRSFKCHSIILAEYHCHQMQCQFISPLHVVVVFVSCFNCAQYNNTLSACQASVFIKLLKSFLRPAPDPRRTPHKPPPERHQSAQNVTHAFYSLYPASMYPRAVQPLQRIIALFSSLRKEFYKFHKKHLTSPIWVDIIRPSKATNDTEIRPIVRAL